MNLAFEGNDIYGNALAGIEIIGDANPVIINNKVRDGKHYNSKRQQSSG